MIIKSDEYINHPQTKISTKIIRLEPGDKIEPGDFYQYMTKYIEVPQSLIGSLISKDCNVHFIRFI